MYAHIRSAFSSFKHAALQGMRAETAEDSAFLPVLYVKLLELEFILDSFVIRQYRRTQALTKESRSEPIIY